MQPCFSIIDILVNRSSPFELEGIALIFYIFACLAEVSNMRRNSCIMSHKHISVKWLFVKEQHFIDYGELIH